MPGRISRRRSTRCCSRSSSGRSRTCSPTARWPTCCCSAASSPGRSPTASRSSAAPRPAQRCRARRRRPINDRSRSSAVWWSTPFPALGASLARSASRRCLATERLRRPPIGLALRFLPFAFDEAPFRFSRHGLRHLAEPSRRARGARRGRPPAALQGAAEGAGALRQAAQHPGRARRRGAAHRRSAPASSRSARALGLVIGRTACRVAEAEALDFLAGYTDRHRLSACRTTSFYRPSIRFKARDASAPIGPAVVAAAASPIRDALAIRVFVDGSAGAAGHAPAGMVRPAARLIADVTDFMTLLPGDVLMTGVAPQARRGFEPAHRSRSRSTASAGSRTESSPAREEAR